MSAAEQSRAGAGNEKRVVKLPLLQVDIERILPHRHPFLFVDEVNEFEDAVYIKGRKYVRAEEPHFQGHFPGRPIMPGVLILESIAQMGAIFAKLSTGGAPLDRLIVFSGAESVRFRRPVYPGDVLDIHMFNHRRRSVHWRIQGEVHVGSELVAEAIVMATQLP